VENFGLPPKSPKGDRPGAYEIASATLMPREVIHVANEELRRNDLREICNALRRRKLAVILCTVGGALAGALAIVPQAQVYTAKTTLEVQGINENFMGMASVDPQAAGNYSATEFNVQTQLKLLASESLLARVREKMAPETLPFASPQTGLLARVRTRLRVVPADPIEFIRDSLEMAALTVNSKAWPSTRVIEIRSDSTSPEIAATFLNTLTSEFIDQTLEGRSKSAQKTNQWLIDKVQDMKAKLDASEGALQEFVRSSGLLFLNEQDTLADTKLKQLQTELGTIQADRIAKQSRYEIANSSPSDSLPDILDDGSLNGYKSKLTELRTQLAEAGSLFTPEHYKVKNIQLQIAEVESALQKQRADIIRRIRNEYEGAQRREKLLSDAYAIQSGAVAAQSDKTLQFATLKREVDANMQLYNSMLQQANQAGIASAVPTTNVRIVDPATPPALPSRPIPLLFIGLGLLTGMIGGCIVAVVRDQMDPSVGASGRAPDLLSVPQLGVIPTVDSRTVVLSRWHRQKRISKMNGDTPAQNELISWHDRESQVAESFRVSVASLMLGNEELSRSSVIVVTSPGPQEGKTTVTCNIAIALAEVGRRVLVIDADMRAPRLHDVFAIPNSWGLSDLLQEQTPIEQYPSDAFMRPTSISGISVLPSGPPTLRIAALFSSSRLRELLERLRDEFDTVLIDTSPMVQFSEARLLSRLSNGVIMVLRSGKTDRDTAVAAAQRLERDGSHLVGTILNDWSPANKRKYNRKHHSQHERTWKAV